MVRHWPFSEPWAPKLLLARTYWWPGIVYLPTQQILLTSVLAFVVNVYITLKSYFGIP